VDAGSSHAESGHGTAGNDHSGAGDQGSPAARRGVAALVPVAEAAEHSGGHAAGQGDPQAHDAVHDDARGEVGHAAAQVVQVPGATSATFLGRGVVTLPTTGVWNAIVRIGKGHESPLEAEAAIDTVDGGPNPLYLGATGSLIGGSLLYGAVERQRRRARDAESIPTQ